MAGRSHRTLKFGPLIASAVRGLAAEPCVPFTRFCLRLGVTDRDTAHVKDCLQFLRKGMRGFYANYAGTSSVVLGLGDRVLLRG